MLEELPISSGAGVFPVPESFCSPDSPAVATPLLVVSTVWDCSTGVRNEQGGKSESWLSQDHPDIILCSNPANIFLQAP